MKWVNRKQTKIITGNTAFEFQEELNKALADIAGKGGIRLNGEETSPAES